MAPTTPTGSRTTSELPTRASNGNAPSSLAKLPQLKTGLPTWIARASLIGMPTSPAISWASASLRAFRPSAIFWMISARLGAGVAAQPSNAARAAATAASASAALPSGMVPITASVVEWITSMVPLPCGATHWPLMNSVSRCCIGARLALVDLRGSRSVDSGLRLGSPAPPGGYDRFIVEPAERAPQTRPAEGVETT